MKNEADITFIRRPGDRYIGCNGLKILASHAILTRGGKIWRAGKLDTRGELILKLYEIFEKLIALSWIIFLLLKLEEGYYIITFDYYPILIRFGSSSH